MSKEKFCISLKAGLANSVKSNMSGKENFSKIIEHLLEDYLHNNKHSLEQCLWPMYLTSNKSQRKSLYEVFPEEILENRKGLSDRLWKKWEVPVKNDISSESAEQMFNRLKEKDRLYVFYINGPEFKIATQDLKLANSFLGVCLNEELDVNFDRLRYEENNSKEDQLYLYQLYEVIIYGQFRDN